MSALTYRRATFRSGGTVLAAAAAAGVATSGAPPITMSRTVSSIDHGLKLTSPIVTARPSRSLSRCCACDLSSGGTASQAAVHRTSTPTTPHPIRRNHFMDKLPANLFNRDSNTMSG